MSLPPNLFHLQSKSAGASYPSPHKLRGGGITVENDLFRPMGPPHRVGFIRWTVALFVIALASALKQP